MFGHQETEAILDREIQRMEACLRFAIRSGDVVDLIDWASVASSAIARIANVACFDLGKLQTPDWPDPCPKCESSENVQIYEGHLGDSWTVMCSCGNRAATSVQISQGNTRREAVASWNAKIRKPKKDDQE